jgi:hypothetical protein
MVSVFKKSPQLRGTASSTAVHNIPVKYRVKAHTVQVCDEKICRKNMKRRTITAGAPSVVICHL